MPNPAIAKTGSLVAIEDPSDSAHPAGDGLHQSHLSELYTPGIKGRRRERTRPMEP